MKKILQTLFLVPLISSCFTVNYKRFTYCQQPSTTKSLVFNTNGLYYSFDRSPFTSYDVGYEHYAGVYFFYKDGSVYSTAIGTRNPSASDLKNKLPGEYHKFVENNRDAAGAFIIVGDTLKVQLFMGTQQRGIYATDVMEQYFIIDRRTNSLTSLKSYCKWCAPNYSGFDKKTGFEKDYVPVQYNFLPLPEKPDSTKMRYKHKRWYKN